MEHTIWKVRRERFLSNSPMQDFVEIRINLAKMIIFSNISAIFWLVFFLIVPHETPLNRADFSCLVIKFLIKFALETST